MSVFPLPVAPVQGMQRKAELLGRFIEARAEIRRRGYETICHARDDKLGVVEEVDERERDITESMLREGFSPIVGVVQLVSPFLDGSGLALLVVDQSYPEPVPVFIDRATSYRLGRLHGIIPSEVPYESWGAVAGMMAEEWPDEIWTFYTFEGEDEGLWALFAEPS